MRVLGIDPGLRRTGYGCIDLAPNAPDPSLVEAGLIRLSPRESVAERLRALATDLRELIVELKPDRLAVEQVFAHPKHVRTAILMAHARGVVVLAGAEAELPMAELAPAEVKVAVAGHGRAGKAQVQQAVTVRCGLAVAPEPDDVSDAIAIAMCAAFRARETPAAMLHEVQRGGRRPGAGGEFGG
ncbi:MAG: crossover junction endodeoxyribonuclease RuvC [Phycisphaerales bacterium]